MTERIQEFLRAVASRARTGPCLVVDLDVVRENYHSFAKALPDSRVFYAVKANPAPEVLSLLAAGLLLRHRFGRRDRDGARRRRHGRPHLLSATPSRRSATSRAPLRSAFGCSRSTARPRSRRSPGRRPGAGCSAASCSVARAPNGRCRENSAATRTMAVEVLEHAHRLGLEPYGVSFHVGSQQRPHAGLGRGAQVGGGDLPRLRRARH